MKDYGAKVRLFHYFCTVFQKRVMKLPIIGRKNMPIPVVGALVKAAAEIKNIPVEIRQNHTDPIRAQRRELRKLLVKAQFTEFGKFYHFDEILLSNKY